MHTAILNLYMYYPHRLIHLEFSRNSTCKGEHSQFSETSLSKCVGHHCTEGLHSMLLCAPTLSYCRQLVKIVSNSLQVIGKWTQPVSCNNFMLPNYLFILSSFLHQVMAGGEVCLMSVCGGGAWEMALARQLQEHINTNKIEKFVPSQTLKQWSMFTLAPLIFLCHRESVLWTAIKALQRVSNCLAIYILYIYIYVYNNTNVC